MSSSMQITPEEAQVLENHEPGWEKIWDKLIQLSEKVQILKYRKPDWTKIRDELIQNLFEKLKDAIADILFLSLYEKDDFFTDMIGDYFERANKGTLLVNYDPCQGNVIDYLTGSVFLNKRAKSYKIKHSSRRVGYTVCRDLKDLDSNAQCSPLRSCQMNENTSSLTDHLSLRDKWLSKSKISRVVEQAGIQLYPWLDWKSSIYQNLLSHLCKVIKAPESDEHKDNNECLPQLAKKHYKSHERYNGKKAAIESQYYKTRAAKASERFKAQLNKLEYDSIFFPIEKEAVAFLLNVTIGTAEKLISRYSIELSNSTLLCS